MAQSAALLDFAGELFEALSRVQARRMFGGAGLFRDGVMFGLADDEVIYLKVDEAVKAEMRAAGSRAWIYMERKGPKAGVAQETSYWSLPEDALDDPEAACGWGARALAVAQAMKAAKPASRSRRRS